MKLTYPACFYRWQNGDGYTVEVPDLTGCVSEGDDLAEAVAMITDAATGWVLGELADGKQLPIASHIEDVEVGEDGFVSNITLDLECCCKNVATKLKG